MDIKSCFRKTEKLYQDAKMVFLSATSEIKIGWKNSLLYNVLNLEDTSGYKMIWTEIPNAEEGSIEVKLQNKDLSIKAKYGATIENGLQDFDEVYDLRNLGQIDVDSITASYKHPRLEIEMRKIEQVMPLVEKKIEVKYMTTK